eukprot:1813100-Rhodomonas_salina.7
MIVISVELLKVLEPSDWMMRHGAPCQPARGGFASEARGAGFVGQRTDAARIRLCSIWPRASSVSSSSRSRGSWVIFRGSHTNGSVAAAAAERASHAPPHNEHASPVHALVPRRVLWLSERNALRQPEPERPACGRRARPVYGSRCSSGRAGTATRVAEPTDVSGRPGDARRDMAV